MKLKQILLGALPLLLLAACSNDNLPEDNGKPEQVPDGYIAVNLQLPTTSGTRAANDVFSDGEPSEYAVNEGIILLFKGSRSTAEGDVVYCGAYDLGFPVTPGSSLDPEDNPNGNVSVSYNRAVKVSGISVTANEKLYGLVFLNQKQANITLSTAGLTIGSTPCAIGQTKFSDIVALTSTQDFYRAVKGEAASSIFMCNSPLSDTSSENMSGEASVNITTLVDLTTGLFPTEQEALANPAGTIYVERAVAKITCSKFITEGSIGANGIESGIEVKSGENEGVKLYVKDVKWALGNIETSSFFVRNIADIKWNLISEHYNGTGSGYRMVSNSGLRKNTNIPLNDAATKLLYRTYWCKDPTYNNDWTNWETFEEDATDGMLTWNKDQILYAHENTFDVERQKYSNTTRVGFWVTFGLGATGQPTTFYIRNNTRTTLYLDDSNGNNPLKNNAIAEISGNESVKNAWKAALKTPEGEGNTNFDPNELLNIETAVSDAGLLSISSISFKENTEIYNQTPVFDFTSLIEEYNKSFQYYEYKGGKAFYEVRIKHFGDDLTPWAVTTSVGDIAGAYPDDPTGSREKNYLGRYGMVRNNWYDLQINSLTSLGDPRDPAKWDTTWGDKPDDNRDMHVAFTIAVLSWAKRTQIVPF